MRVSHVGVPLTPRTIKCLHTRTEKSGGVFHSESKQIPRASKSNMTVRASDAVVEESKSSYEPKLVWFATSMEEEKVLLDMMINGFIVGAALSFAVVNFFTIDKDYWTV